MRRLPPKPDLDWSAGPPRAAAFDDVYFSREGGLAESDAVFLAGCGLPEAWVGRDRFAICELGFGTGLNVLATWRAWKRTRRPYAILHMFSVEACPLERADAARALADFPEIAPLATQLIERWPVRAYGPQRIWLEEDAFALTIIIGDASEALERMHGRFDAWFLDGFAPARNPQMWRASMFQRIAQLSAPGARVATFSVAGEARRGLEAAGFAVEKKPGFGAKRERLEGRIDVPPQEPEPLYPYAGEAPKGVAIVGGGVAGAATARALARRGVEPTIVDTTASREKSASANPAGIVMPRLDRGGSGLSELFLAAYLDAVTTYEALGPDVFLACGVEHSYEARHLEALVDLLADPPLPEDWFARLSETSALHPRAGFVRAPAVIAAWTQRARALDGLVARLERGDDAWRLIDADGKTLLDADVVVLACGPALGRFEAARFLPLEFSCGQIECGPLEDAPQRARVRGAYVAPLDEGVMFGATFDRVDTDEPPAIDNDARRRNLAALEEIAPDIAARIDAAKLTSRAALRVATPDRAPIAGLLPDAPAWLAQNAAIAHGRKPEMNKAAPALPGVYVLGGLGARGLTLAPLLGERIAAEMFNEPQALSRAALDAIHPARFLHRALKRGG